MPRLPVIERSLAPADHRVCARLEVKICLRPHRLHDIHDRRKILPRVASSLPCGELRHSKSSGRIPRSIVLPRKLPRPDLPIRGGKETSIAPPSISEKRDNRLPPSSVPLMKFIGGLPKKPATNKFTGSL